MSQKLVSVIMPAYNSQRYISKSIASVIEQSYSNWELIIVDNNSKDKTAEIIKDYAKRDSRIKYILGNTKKGAAYARNLAIKEAKGDYIAFLDSDDVYLSEKLEKHIAFMEEHNLYLSYTSYKTYGESSNVVENKSSVSYQDLLKHNVIGCSTAIYNLSKLKRKFYMPELRIAEDWCLWCEILKESKSKALMLKQPLTLYRIDQNSLSANKLKCAYYHYKALRSFMKVNVFKAVWLFSIYAYTNSRKVLSYRTILRMAGIRKKK